MEDYVITVKGKEVSRHKTEREARSAWHKLRKKHSSAQNDVKVVKEDITLKDIAKKEKESMYDTGAQTSKTIRIMQKQIKREKSDDVIIVKLSPIKDGKWIQRMKEYGYSEKEIQRLIDKDGDSVMRVGKDELKKYLKKGYEKLK